MPLLIISDKRFDFFLGFGGGPHVTFILLKKAVFKGKKALSKTPIVIKIPLALTEIPPLNRAATRKW